MHYCLALITTKFPTDERIEERLQPYYFDNWCNQEQEWELGNAVVKPERPAFVMDYWRLGGRYSGMLKLKAGEKKTKYEWEYCYLKEPRNNRLFRSTLLDKVVKSEPFKECEDEFFTELGFDDGYIRLDACRVRDLYSKENLRTFCLLDADNTYYARQKWDGKQWIEDAHFDEKMQEILNMRDDCYISIIDFHD